MALILFIDTSTSEALLGLAENGVWLVTKMLPDARKLGEILHTEVAGLLHNAARSLIDLSAVAVVSGPGSYTGLRVGMAAAKGWCFGLDIPLIALNRLEILATQHLEKQSLPEKTLVILPARVGEWFVIGMGTQKQITLPAQHVDLVMLKKIVRENGFQQAVMTSEPADLPLSSMQVTFFENKLTFDGLNHTLLQAYTGKQFQDIKYAKPEYLKNAYIFH